MCVSCSQVWGTVPGIQQAHRCLRTTHPCLICPGDVQEGSEDVSGGREELMAACVTQIWGRMAVPGRTDASAIKEKRLSKD